MGDWIATWSGQKFYFDEPKKYDYTIDEIAHALAFQCRFNGHTKAFYSVAQHSILCYRLGKEIAVIRDIKLTKETTLALLLHDAAEAFIGDVVRPLKRSLPDYQEIEGRIQLAIYDAFLIDKKSIQPIFVDKVDLAALAYERKHFLLPFNHEWECLKDVVVHPRRIELPHETHAKEVFIEIFLKEYNT